MNHSRNERKNTTRWFVSLPFFTQQPFAEINAAQFSFQLALRTKIPSDNLSAINKTSNLLPSCYNLNHFFFNTAKN